MNHGSQCVCDTCLLNGMQHPNPQIQSRSWGRWYRRDRAALLHFVQGRRYFCRPDNAQDLVHDAFLTAFEAIRNGRYQRIGRPLLAYLYGVTTNLLRDHQRKERRAGDSLPLDLANASLPSPDELAFLHEIGGRISAALATLSPRQLQVLSALYFRGMKAQAVARKLGISPENVRTIARRAVATIIEQVSAELELPVATRGVRHFLRYIDAASAAEPVATPSVTFRAVET